MRVPTVFCPRSVNVYLQHEGVVAKVKVSKLNVSRPSHFGPAMTRRDISHEQDVETLVKCHTLTSFPSLYTAEPVSNVPSG